MSQRALGLMKRRLWALKPGSGGQATFWDLYRFLYAQQRIDRDTSLAALKQGEKAKVLEVDRTKVPTPEEGELKSPENYWVITVVEEDPRLEAEEQ